jgi:H+/Cl- antiporter ClcA
LLAILLGGVWSMLWPGTPLGAFAVIGAGAFLASSMRVPLTAVALIFEFTQPSQAFLIPVLIAVAGSVAASECVSNLVTARAREGVAAQAKA